MPTCVPQLGTAVGATPLQLLIVTWRQIMTKLKLLSAVAVLSTALATPLMAQEATQEPGMIGFNYPNTNYLTGGFGVRLPYNTGHYPRMPPGYAVGPGGYRPYGAFGYYPY